MKFGIWPLQQNCRLALNQTRQLEVYVCVFAILLTKMQQTRGMKFHMWY